MKAVQRSNLVIIFGLLLFVSIGMYDKAIRSERAFQSLHLAPSTFWATRPGSGGHPLCCHLQLGGPGIPPRLHIVAFRAEPPSPPRPEYGGPADHVERNGNILTFRISTEGVSFSGTLASGAISGVWTNPDSTMFDMTLYPVDPPPFMFTRQHPHPPYTYIVEDRTIPGGQGRPQLAGTLTRPVGPGSFPAVLLLSGQGPEGRDAETRFHRPFLVWADFLTRNGMVVLRCDDRGVGLSEGDFNSATTADFIEDARAALDFLKTHPEVDRSRIGMLGHSEGGLVAAAVASDSPDVGFVVLLAPPVCPMNTIWKQQFGVMAQKGGLNDQQKRLGEEFVEGAFRTLAMNSPTAGGRQAFRDYYTSCLNAIPEQDRRMVGFPSSDGDLAGIEAQLDIWCTPWKYFITRFDSAAAYRGVSCPVLGVFAGLDEQILPEPNVRLLEHLLGTGRCASFKTHVFPDLDHPMHRPTNFETATYPLPETVSTDVLVHVLTWLQALPGNSR